MTLPITPSGAPFFPSTQNSPANGDPLDATQLRNDIETPFLDGIEGARLLLYGGGFYPRVKATSNTVMVIQPMGAAIAKVGTNWRVVAHTIATTIDPLALAGGAFAANTRYYVYVNLVAGVITWSVSTTAPDAGYRYKTGDEQYQFVSTFYTDHVPDLLTYTQSGKTYTYATVTATGGGVRGNILLDAGTAIAITNVVTVGGAIPAGASEYRLYGQSMTAAVAGVVYLGDPLPSPNSRIFYPPGGILTPYTQETTWAAPPQLQYFVDAGTTALNLWALQFTL